MQYAWKVYLLGLLEAIPILFLCTALATQNCYERARRSRFGNHPQRLEKAPCQRYSSRRSFRPPLVCFPQGYKVGHVPQPICDASGHRWSPANCTMNLDEVVGEIIERRRCGVILQLARESVAQARVSPLRPGLLTTHPLPGATLRAVAKEFPSSAPDSDSDVVAGTLYLVGTPIGNLEDITLRALRILKEVDLIACEDTRQTMKLLDHYGIEKPTVSYHEHNELTRAAELVVHLERGDNIAMVSDAGMPGVSDPGYRLVALAVRHHIRVVPIPGASAFLSALVASGLPTDSFHFGGFLPAKEGARRTVLEVVRTSPRTEIFYEAPHRVVETLRDIVDTLGPERHVVIAREVTKLHEEFLRGRAEDLSAQLQARGEVRGEITLLIGKGEEGSPQHPSGKTIAQRVRELVAAEQLDEKAALKQAAREFGLSKSATYREFQRGK